MSNTLTSILDRLKSTHDVLLHYFPLHSALAEWGKPLEEHLSQWIVDHPEEYQDAIVQSLEAGCDLVSTSTQASSPWRAAVFGLGDRVHDLNYQSAALARSVVPPDKYLCGFVSSTNPDFLEPVGSLSRSEVYEGYKEQISALLEGGVDCIMIVGNHLDEAIVAVEVTKDLSPVPVILQNVFYTGLSGYRTMMGHDVAAASRLAGDAGADIVGASCGLMKEGEPAPGHTGYYEAATSLVREMRRGYDGFLSIQPNAGMAQLREGETCYPATPDELSSEVESWVEAGARIVGGCCGTSLDHYRAISRVLRGDGWR